MGAHFLSSQLFQARLLLSCSCGTKSKVLPVQRRSSRHSSSARRLTVERVLNRRNTGEAEMRTALIVATTVTLMIDAQAQTRGGSAQPAGKGRVETQAQCEARQ